MKFYSKLLIVMFVLGLLLFGTSIALGFNFQGAVDFLSDDENYTLAEPIIFEDEINKINVEFDIRNIIIQTSDDDKIRLEYYINKYDTWSIDVTNGTLDIKQKVGDVSYYIKIIPKIFSDKSNVHLYIPSNLTLDYNLKVTTGNIKLEQINASSLKLTSTTGNINILDSNCLSNTTITTRTGNTTLNDFTTVDDLTINGTTGNVKVENTTATNLTSKTTTGNTTLTEVLIANNLTATASTGNVTLNLTTAQDFNLTTSTGNIRFTADNIANINYNLKVSTGAIKVDGVKQGKTYLTSGHDISLVAQTSTGNINIFKH